MKNIVSELNALKSTAIEVAIIYNTLYFVTLHDDEDYMKAFKISPLLGYQEISGGIEVIRARIIQFPDGYDTFDELLSDPMVFAKWYDEELKPYL